MRIRSIKPGFWRSDDIDALDWHTRLLFIGLWSYVDDNGVGRDRESDIAGDLFSADLSRDTRETLARVADGLQQLVSGGQISRYTVDGKRYIHVTSWTDHQKIDRPGASRYPLPTSTDAIPRDTLATPSREVRETPSTGEGEKGRRGEVLSSDQSDPSDRFDEFWRHYPRKEAKQDARKAWATVTKKINPQDVIDGLTTFVFSPEAKYRPLPGKWLRGHRWADESSALALDNSRKLTGSEIDDLLGTDYWSPPLPPASVPREQVWEWQTELRKEHIAERHAEARRRLGMTA